MPAAAAQRKAVQSPWEKPGRGSVAFYEDNKVIIVEYTHKVFGVDQK